MCGAAAAPSRSAAGGGNADREHVGVWKLNLSGRVEGEWRRAQRDLRLPALFHRHALDEKREALGLRRLDRDRRQAECDRVDPHSALAIALDEALARLSRLNQRQARVVECRFFAGMDVEQTAEALGTSPATVKRDWVAARAWLNREMSGAAHP